ncbi:MAG: hypothetical protein ACXQS2_01215, partial [Methermicoccaceae archaeon]
NIKEKINPLMGIPDEVKKLKKRLAELKAGHDEYLSYQKLASTSEYEQARDEVKKLDVTISLLEDVLKIASEEYYGLLNSYPEEAYDNLEAEKLKTEELRQLIHDYLIKLRGKLDEMHHQKEETTQKLKELDELRRTQQKYESLSSFVEFSRQVIRRAGRLLANRIIEEVSTEAAEMFYDAMGTHTQQLIWSSDEDSIYELRVRAEGEERSFFQLSGGEQMCASISLRLALLRILADVDFVFLDEPTANLDELRKENLSKLISGMRDFRQVFVITHDDSFSDKYDNLIQVIKSGGVSEISDNIDEYGTLEGV